MQYKAIRDKEWEILVFAGGKFGAQIVHILHLHNKRRFPTMDGKCTSCAAEVPKAYHWLHLANKHKDLTLS